MLHDYDAHNSIRDLKQSKSFKAIMYNRIQS